MYVITGAAGHTGHIITEKLLANGQPVRVVGRHADRLKSLADMGAEPLVGSLDDAAFLTKAFNGAKAVYALTPFDPQTPDFRAFQNRVGEAVTTAIKNAGVQYVLNLSSLGGHLTERTGPVLGLHDQEERLNQLTGVNIVHLRPTYFMENLLGNIPVIKQMGIHGSALRGDVAFPIIATPDIAKVAAEYLLALNFSGHQVRELLGQRDVSMNEATPIFGRAIGLPNLPYVQFPYAEVEKALMGYGFSANVAGLMMELTESINEGYAITGTPRTPANTTATSIEEFAQTTFAAVYRQG